MKVTTVAILVICSVVCCNAQHAAIKNKKHVVTDVRSGAGIPNFWNSDPNHALVKLKKGFSANDAVKKGIKVIQLFENDELIVERTGKIPEPNAEIIERILPVNFLWKLSDNITPESIGSQTQCIIRSSNPNDLAETLRRMHLDVSFPYEAFVRVKGNLAGIMPVILQRRDVTYVGNESFVPTEESTVLDLYLGPNKINKVHHDFPSLNGTGIVISVKERHYDVEDIDLRGRHISSALGATDTSNHATEMATLVAGAGNSFITGRGVAPHANITSSSFFDLFPDSEAEFSAVNSALQNHSYGTVIENFYGSLANAYDQHVYENPEIFHVFSSGNSGMSNAASGVYTAVTGFSNLTGNSKMAKNVLVVGSVDTTGNALAFSSRGPTNDGRIKPEIMAYSTAGTSNSSAVVSGVGGLLQQAYKNIHGNFPEAALLKALLINSADDVGLPGIDFISGFGNLNAFRSMENLLNGRYYQGTVGQNGIIDFALNLPANVKNLKVTLVWTDYPGIVNATKPLVNNLDLQVGSPAGVVLPWILNPTPNAASLTAPATRGFDNTNNVEQVTIETPAPGVHTFSVKAASLVTANQKFYIAYQWDENDSFTWSYPTGSDNFPYNGETGTYFYWKSTLSDLSGDLEVSTDDGTTWKPIAKSLVLKKGYYRWQNPAPVNVAAKARMKVNGNFYETDEFTISRTLLPSLGFNCGDSVLLQWGSMLNVLEYDVRKLDGNYPTLLSTLADTALVIRKNPSISSYSIGPKLATGKPLLRSPAIDIEKYGAGCFVTTFVDEEISEAGILLRLELGTTYGVTEVFFEHLESGEFAVINTRSDPDNGIIRFLHDDPLQGINHYRARIQLQNDQEILSDTIQNYFLTKTPFIVFPNPVTRAQDINVYAARFETIDFTFSLFDAKGAWVLSVALQSDREFVNTDGLPPGLYFYKIQGNEVNVSGKIVVK